MPPGSRPPLRLWRCPSCTQRTHRPFSTTPPSKRIGPEHPKYIDVPPPVQPSKPEQRRIRGSLPVPRDIFHPRRGGVDKVTPAYLDAMTAKPKRPSPSPDPSPTATPMPTSSQKPEAQTEAARQVWKARMSDLRRQNLRDGLQALQARRRRFDAQTARRTAEQRRVLKEAAERPPPEDERLTSPSVTRLLQEKKQRGYRVPDPHRAERVAAMRVRVQEKEEGRKAARLAALQGLYMNARSFIVSEEELHRAIEVQFGTVKRPAMFDWRGTSIWHSKLPESVQDKMNKVAAKAPAEESASYTSRLRDQRLKKIAKELMGGSV